MKAECIKMPQEVKFDLILKPQMKVRSFIKMTMISLGIRGTVWKNENVGKNLILVLVSYFRIFSCQEIRSRLETSAFILSCLSY